MHTTANSFLILLLALSLSTLSISLANASSLTSRKNNAIYQKIVNSGTSKDPLDSLTVDERRFFEDFTAVASENSSSFIAAPSLIRATPMSGCWNASFKPIRIMYSVIFCLRRRSRVNGAMQVAGLPVALKLTIGGKRICRGGFSQAQNHLQVSMGQ